MKDKELEGKIKEILTPKPIYTNRVIGKDLTAIDWVTPSPEDIIKELLELIQKEREGAVRGFAEWINALGDRESSIYNNQLEDYIKQLREEK